MKKVIILAIFLISFSACNNQPPARKGEIEAEVFTKIQEYVSTRYKDCKTISVRKEDSSLSGTGESVSYHVLVEQKNKRRVLVIVLADFEKENGDQEKIAFEPKSEFPKKPECEEMEDPDPEPAEPQI